MLRDKKKIYTILFDIKIEANRGNGIGSGLQIISLLVRSISLSCYITKDIFQNKTVQKKTNSTDNPEIDGHLSYTVNNNFAFFSH